MKKTDVIVCAESTIQLFSQLRPCSRFKFRRNTPFQGRRLQAHLKPTQLATHRRPTHCRAPLPRNPRVYSIYRNLAIPWFSTVHCRTYLRRLHLFPAQRCHFPFEPRRPSHKPHPHRRRGCGRAKFSKRGAANGD